VDYSNYGIYGALIGLVLGFLDYAIIMRVMERALAREAGGEVPSAEGRVKVERIMGFLKPALMFGSFVVFPVVGYFVGKQVMS
jgi:hypothetical protein